MNPKKIWANFSVQDAARSNQFYTQLGFKPSNTNNYPKLASFAFGGNGFVIHFFEQGSQINDFLTVGATNEIIFTLSAQTEQEVKDWETDIIAAGGSIFQPAGRDKNGYYGCGFADPDGYKFNILLMEEGM